MAGDRIPSLILQLIDELRARGVVITIRGGDWCVRAKGEPEETGYLTDDLKEAFEHGRALAISRTVTPVADDKPTATVAKWRRPTGAKTRRKRWFRAHNHRVRGWAIKKLREEGRG